ncbi:MAG: protein kinase [Nitrospiraceae bacterium]
MDIAFTLKTLPPPVLVSLGVLTLLAMAGLAWWVMRQSSESGETSALCERTDTPRNTTASPVEQEDADLDDLPDVTRIPPTSFREQAPVDTTTAHKSDSEADESFDTDLESAADAATITTQTTKPVDTLPDRTERIGHYAIVEELPPSIVGAVYLAQDREKQRQVQLQTIEIVSEAGGERRQQWVQLQKEFARYARLHHPNIAAVYEGLQQDGLVALANERIEGNALGQGADQAQLPLTQAVNLVAIAADAVDYAHRLGLVHGGLAPSAIVRTPDHRIVVADFGLALLVDFSGIRPYLPDHQLRYRAPELRMAEVDAQGSSQRPQITGARADVYALGMILSDLIAESASTSAPVPSGIRQALERATRPDPAHRHTKAADFAHALRMGMLSEAA